MALETIRLFVSLSAALHRAANVPAMASVMACIAFSGVQPLGTRKNPPDCSDGR